MTPLCPSSSRCGIIPAVQKILYAIGGVLLLLVAIGLALPRKATVSVSADIDAFPATVYALINDFDRVVLWSPRFETDPNARVVYGGPERGIDATMTWDGPVIGTGMQIITESRPIDYIEIAINPGTPGSARSWFEIEDRSAGTQLRWTHETDYGFNLVARYFAPLFSGVVERDHARGIVNLKDLAESLPRVDFSDMEIERIVVDAMQIAYLSTTSRPEPAAISEAMGEAYFEILNFIDTHGLSEAGAPLSIMRTFTGSKLAFDAAIPVRGVTAETPTDGSGVRIGRSYAGIVIRVRHIGSYRKLGATHQMISAYLAALGIERNGDAWESYVSDPTKVPEDELMTYVYYPIRP